MYSGAAGAEKRKTGDQLWRIVAKAFAAVFLH